MSAQQTDQISMHRNERLYQQTPARAAGIIHYRKKGMNIRLN